MEIESSDFQHGGRNREFLILRPARSNSNIPTSSILKEMQSFGNFMGNLAQGQIVAVFPHVLEPKWWCLEVLITMLKAGEVR